MENFNKFKMLTLIFLCLFVFAVAAIYTNTKEASEQKLKTEKQNKINTERIKQDKADSEDYSDLAAKIEDLSNKVDNYIISKNDGQKMNCSIIGISDGENIEKISDSSAISEAQDSGRKLIMECGFSQ